MQALRDVVHDIRRTRTDHMSGPNLHINSGHRTDHTNRAVPTLREWVLQT